MTLTLRKLTFQLSEIEEWLEKQRCKWCNGKLTLKYYSHPDGIQVQGHGRIWIYGECTNCGYQWALWKLGFFKEG